MTEEKQLQTTNTELSVQDVQGQVHKIQELMKAIMKKGEHYGTIPGTPKPTLLKPGAEKLCLTFRLAPEYEELSSLHKENHIGYRIKCRLRHINSGNVVGEGLGSCNSKEKKYRNSEPWDIDNTLLKMASKRALVAAILNATAASDIFTQDLEDMPKEETPEYVPAEKEENKPEKCGECGAAVRFVPAGVKDGKKYGSFWGCSAYPDCKWIQKA